MGKPLTNDGNVLCGHDPGKAAVSSSAKLKVSGQSVLLQSDIEGTKVSDCATEDTKDSKGIVTQKCHNVLSLTAGQSKKLTVNKKPVILDDGLKGTTDGWLKSVTPVADLKGSARQKKLTAV